MKILDSLVNNNVNLLFEVWIPWIESKALHKIDKCSTTELYSLLASPSQ